MDQHQATAGASWQEIAHEAYSAFTMNNDHQANLIDWAGLPRHIQISWEAAVRHVAECLNNPLSVCDLDRWYGWLPPGEADKPGAEPDGRTDPPVILTGYGYEGGY